MSYCSNCGQKLEGDFYFCPKCGSKTKAGTAAGVKEPWDAFRDAFITAGEEMRKAAAEAKREAQARKAVKNISCSSCGTTNLPDSKFCQKCGKPLS